MDNKLPYNNDALQKAIDLVSLLDYPNEIVYYEMKSKIPNLSIIDKHEKTLVQKLPYTFLANMSYNFRKKMKNLGLITIDINELNDCNTITSSYSLPIRIHSRRHDVPLSCYDYWKDHKEQVIEIAKVQLSKHLDRYKQSHLPPSQDALENECAIALFKTGIPGCFPSTLVTTMIDELAKRPEFKEFSEKYAKKQIHMLDISAGWGDRLLAACSRGYFYTGCDPNTAMQKCYDNIIKNHDEDNKHFSKQLVYFSPFEDWNEDKNAYGKRYDTCSSHIVYPNFMISSPPFFNLEIYSKESTQSSERYPLINDWIEKFLKPSLKKTSGLLEPNSPVILHLSDVINFKDNAKSIIFVEKIIEWCVHKLGWTFIGNYGFTMFDVRKETETDEIRQEKDANKLLPKGITKKYENGLRCNNKGEYFSQPLWVFRT